MPLLLIGLAILATGGGVFLAGEGVNQAGQGTAKASVSLGGLALVGVGLYVIARKG